MTLRWLFVKTRGCLRLFVCDESGKRKGCKKKKKKHSRAEVVGFYGPPTLSLNCHRVGGGGQEEGGGVVTVKEGEESDGAAVIHELIQDRFHWCQKGYKCAGQPEGKA